MLKAHTTRIQTQKKTPNKCSSATQMRFFSSSLFLWFLLFYKLTKICLLCTRKAVLRSFQIIIKSVANWIQFSESIDNLSISNSILGEKKCKQVYISLATQSSYRSVFSSSICNLCVWIHTHSHLIAFTKALTSSWQSCIWVQFSVKFNKTNKKNCLRLDVKCLMESLFLHCTILSWFVSQLVDRKLKSVNFHSSKSRLWKSWVRLIPKSCFFFPCCLIAV